MTQRFCEQCGTSRQGHHKFCTNCGASFAVADNYPSPSAEMMDQAETLRKHELPEDNWDPDLDEPSIQDRPAFLDAAEVPAEFEDSTSSVYSDSKSAIVGIVVIGVLLAVLAGWYFSDKVFPEAEPQPTHFVTAAGLNCREEPTTRSAVVMQYAQDDQIVSWEERNGWIKSQNECWVSGSYVSEIVATGQPADSAEAQGNLGDCHAPDDNCEPLNLVGAPSSPYASALGKHRILTSLNEELSSNGIPCLVENGTRNFNEGISVVQPQGQAATSLPTVYRIDFEALCPNINLGSACGSGGCFDPAFAVQENGAVIELT